MPDLHRAVASMFAIGFEGKTLSPSLKGLLDRGVGGVILFSRNVESPKQIARLCYDIQTHAGRPILIATDQEGGRVARLRSGFTPIPPMRTLGQLDDEKLTYQIGQVMAAELRAVNIHMNLAPVLDVDSNPKNPVIADRSLGPDPDLVSRLGAALINGLQKSGVASCAKHFPGHGDTSKDSHFDLPRLEHPLSRLEKVELPPFQAAIDAKVAAIMTAHIIFDALDPNLPATMSKNVLTNLLRQKMHFDGLLISDALEMKAIADHFPLEQVIIQGITAGLDLLAICENPDLQNRAIDILTEAATSEKISQQQIQSANARLGRVIKQFFHPPTPTLDLSILNSPKHRAIIDQITPVPIGPDPTERSTI